MICQSRLIDYDILILCDIMITIWCFKYQIAMYYESIIVRYSECKTKEMVYILRETKEKSKFL
jgi:hypothetical protein